MVSPDSIELAKSQGPSGFIEYGGETFVVDYGKVYLDGSPIGFLFEDGYFQATSGPLGDSGQLRPIEALAGCLFRGIDAAGNKLDLPGAVSGPSGNLIYNGIPFNVTNGRLSTLAHELVGTFDEQGRISIKAKGELNCLYGLDQETQLNTNFVGQKSNGSPWQYEYVRPTRHYRKDRSYADNEIMRYFLDFDGLTAQQKRYVLETMQIWAASGILQLVRKSEGDASLGNVKHGAAGVTGFGTGNATFDKEEFETDVGHYNKFGPLFHVGRPVNVLEVRLSLVVPHEFGHQLEFSLTQASQDEIASMYNQRLAACQRLHKLPTSYGEAELLMNHQVESRHFISGYAKTSMHEYFAESVAAFSVLKTRELLREFDASMYKLLADVVLRPASRLRVVLHETLAALQASLRLGGEFSDDLLSK